MRWTFFLECLKNRRDFFWEEDDTQFCARDLYELVEKISNKSIGTGLKCAVLCESSLKAAVYFLASWKNGNTVIPLSLNYGKEHCDNILKLTNPDIILSDSENVAQLFGDKVCNLFDDKSSKSFIKKEKENKLENVCLIMCTSGTTGSPKGAMITYDGLVENVKNIVEYFDIDTKDKILIARPLYHTAVMVGEFLVSLYKGASIVFYSGKYNPMLIARRMEAVSVLCGTPTMLRQLSMIYRCFKKEVSLSKIALSGECLDESTAGIIRGTFENAKIYNVYGLTEAGPRVSYLPPDDFERKPESVGIPLKNTIVKICDSKMIEVEGRDVGEICVKSPSLMKGYYNHPEMTKETLVDGYLKTGDIGYKDEDGYLYILSRKDDLIIKGGMNIYPREVENYIEKYPGVKECVVYGVKYRGTQMIVCDAVIDTDKFDKQGLLHTIPEYLRPNKINIVNKIYKNASGKKMRKK